MNEKKSNKWIWIAVSLLIFLPAAAIGLVVLSGVFSRPSIDELGGTRLTYHVDWEQALERGVIAEYQYEERAQLLTAVIEILQERLDPRGRHGIEITPLGGDRLVIDVPDFEVSEGFPPPAETVRSLTESTGAMRFYIAAEEGDFTGGVDLASELSRAEAWGQENPDADWSAYNDLLAAGDEPTRSLRAFPRRVIDQTGRPVDSGITLLWQPKVEWTFTGDDLVAVAPCVDRMGYPAIGMHLDSARASAFEEFTTANIDRGLAIVIDEVIVSLATIRTTLGTDFILEGQFTPDEVDRIVHTLRSGALIVKPVLESVERVAPVGD